ncbi:MAG: hypothetical protein HYT87_09580 [Nitrospirae bacterium]|nr:hypothetical protein [Nitrospirota bacterium]
MNRNDLATEIERAASILPRRGFLKLAGGAAVAGLLPTSCADLPRHLQVPPSRPLKVLKLWEYAFITAMTRRMLGRRPAEMIDAREVDPAVYLDDILPLLDPGIYEPLRYVFGLVEYFPWPILPKWGRFTRSSEEVQDRVLLDMQDSRSEVLRAAFTAFKLLSGPSFYAHPAAWKLMDYPGPPWRAPERHAESMRYPASWPAIH